MISRKKRTEIMDFQHVQLVSGQDWIVSGQDVLTCVYALLCASMAISKIPEKKRTANEKYLLSEFNRVLAKESDWMKKMEEVNG